MSDRDASTVPPQPVSSLAGSTALVLGASAVAGLLGFVLNFVVARNIGASHVAGFSAVWSGTYLVCGALLGIQQETSRAARPRVSGLRAPLARLAALTALVTFFLAAGIATAWVFPVFGASGWTLIPPLAVGPAGYVVVGFVVGSLYGLHRWLEIALVIVTDAVLRFAAVAAVLLVTHDITAIAWAIALPFGLALVLLAPRLRRALSGGVRFDVPGARLVGNVGKSVVASLSTAIMVSGFSLLLVASSSDEPAARVGAVAFAVTVVRAPIMIGVAAAQGLLIVRFRDSHRAAGAAVLLALLLLAIGVVLAVLAFFIGDPLLEVVVGPGYRIGGGTLALIVASSTLVGLLFVTGPLALALGRHTVFALGWAIAAPATVLILLLPVEFEFRLMTALIIPPLLGLAVHAGGLRVMRGRPRPAPSPPPAL